MYKKELPQMLFIALETALLKYTIALSVLYCHQYQL